MTKNTAEAQVQAWLKLLVDVSQEFSTTLEIDEILSKVLAMTIRVVKASEGSIFVLNTAGLVVKSIIAREELPPEVKSPTIEKVMQDGIAGWVDEHKDYIVIEDTKDDPRWRDLPGDRLMTRSAIGVPLLKNDELIGIMTLTDPEPNKFSENYVTYLRPIADQAANAIDNAMVYTKTKGEWVALQAIIHAVQAPIMVFDEENKLILFNQATADAMDLTANEIGKLADEVIKEASLLAFYQEDVDQEQSDREIVFSNNRIFDCSLTSVQGVGQIISLHDITVLRKLMQLVSDWS